MSDDLVELSEPMTLMRTKDVRHLLDRIEKLEAERDEALNQLDSARHSIDVLERRVAELKHTES